MESPHRSMLLASIGLQSIQSAPDGWYSHMRDTRLKVGEEEQDRGMNWQSTTAAHPTCAPPGGGEARMKSQS